MFALSSQLQTGKIPVDGKQYSTIGIPEKELHLLIPFATFSIWSEFSAETCIVYMTLNCQIWKPVHMLTSKFWGINLSIGYKLVKQWFYIPYSKDGVHDKKIYFFSFNLWNIWCQTCESLNVNVTTLWGGVTIIGTRRALHGSTHRRKQHGRPWHKTIFLTYINKLNPRFSSNSHRWLSLKNICSGVIIINNYVKVLQVRRFKEAGRVAGKMENAEPIPVFYDAFFL